MKYRPEVDGLRAVAVLPVVLFHAGLPAFSGGFVGVDVFFVISGYLVGTIILTEIAEGRFSFVTFYERRARLILPALFAVLAVSTPLAIALMLPFQLIEYGWNLLGVGLFGSNITLWQQGGYFGGPAELKPLLHTWSLAIEEQFYILFPLLAIFLSIFRASWVFATTIAVLTAASFYVAERYSFRFETATFYLLPTRSWELGVGILVALYLIKRPSLFGVVGQFVSVGGLAAIFMSIGLFDETTRYPSLYTLLPVLGAAAILLGANDETFVGRILSRPAFLWLGLISYSIYLWHQPLFAFARLARPDLADQPVIIMGITLGSIGLGWVSWRFVERPFRSKTRIASARIFTLGSIGVMAGVAMGAVFVLSRGFIDLYPQNNQALLSVLPADVHQYVSDKYNAKARGREVSEEEKTVLLIGDSYSQDLFNMIVENGAFINYRVAARYVAARCQVYAGEVPVQEFQSRTNSEFCAQNNYNVTPGLMEEAQRADIVLLASRWSEWAGSRVSETVKAFQKIPGETLFVLGTKSFGPIDFRELAEMSTEERLAYRVKITSERVSTNEVMRSAGLADGFIDVFHLYCSSNYECPQFTPSGSLFSVDGSHLTPAGAQHLGSLVFSHSPLSKFASLPSKS